MTLRIYPRLDVRVRAAAFAPEARNRWEAQLLGYQRMPDDLLFAVRPVRLTRPIEEIMSRPGLRVTCAVCGEEIINGREVAGPDGPICQTCAGDAYYTAACDVTVEPWRALFENTEAADFTEKL